jgi:hypothetical protein
VLRPLDTLYIDAFLHHLPQGAHFSQSFHMLDAPFRSVVHLFHRRKPAKSEPARKRQRVFTADVACVDIT